PRAARRGECATETPRHGESFRFSLCLCASVADGSLPRRPCLTFPTACYATAHVFGRADRAWPDVVGPFHRHGARRTRALSSKARRRSAQVMDSRHPLADL